MQLLCGFVILCSFASAFHALNLQHFHFPGNPPEATHRTSKSHPARPKKTPPETCCGRRKPGMAAILLLYFLARRASSRGSGRSGHIRASTNTELGMSRGKMHKRSLRQRAPSATRYVPALSVERREKKTAISTSTRIRDPDLRTL